MTFVSPVISEESSINTINQIYPPDTYGCLLENDKNKGGSEEETRLKTRLRKEKAIIGGRDGNLKL